MIEAELKITLDAADMARLRRHAELAALRAEPRRTVRLLSVYYDTEGHALAKAGIALRLRKSGRAWVQTIKSARTAGGAGFYAQQELEIGAPGGRLALDGPDPTGALAAVRAAAGEAPLGPVFETRVERVVERLKLDDGVVELALDKGEVVAGAAHAPILEAEIELVAGDLSAVFALARRLFPGGPVRFATANKAAVGYGLLRDGVAAPKARARNAGTPEYDGAASVETVARDVLRDCFAQIAANVVTIADSEIIEGPHQLRVGLRRLRTALSVFAPSLGEEALAPLSEAARRLGQVVGHLRDSDVLADEVVAGTAALGLDAQAAAALGAALAGQRTRLRAEVRTALAGPETTAFLFDLLELIEARGWLAPADYAQTARLAAPIESVAAGWLDRRHAKALKRGRKIETLDAEALHDLRKELKKLRYAADILGPIYPGKRVARYLRALKDMQDTFGSMNDAAMASEALSSPDAPGRGDPDAQRAAGWALGALAVKVGQDRPQLFERWQALAETKPFWS